MLAVDPARPSLVVALKLRRRGGALNSRHRPSSTVQPSPSALSTCHSLTFAPEVPTPRLPPKGGIVLILFTAILPLLGVETPVSPWPTRLAELLGNLDQRWC